MRINARTPSQISGGNHGCKLIPVRVEIRSALQIRIEASDHHLHLPATPILAMIDYKKKVEARAETLRGPRVAFESHRRSSKQPSFGELLESLGKQRLKAERAHASLPKVESILFQHAARRWPVNDAEVCPPFL
jgi:hypothetical protein